MKSPKDAILTVETYRIDDAIGEKLFSTNIFNDGDEERLNALLESYPDMRREKVERVGTEN